MNATSQPATPETEPPVAIPVSIPTEHGPLNGRLLALSPNACGLVVLAHAGATPDAHGEALAAIFRQAGLASFVIDLLTNQEERFADVHNNVPLLVKRLLACLTRIKRRMENGELPTLPIGLCAADSASPASIRVAALRDHDIAAVICCGGLIDLAGMLYLRTLESPLLVLVDAADQRLLASNRRALQEVTCRNELMLIPGSNGDVFAAASFEGTAERITNWFIESFAPQISAGVTM